MIANGCRVSFENDENILKLIMVKIIKSLNIRTSQVARWSRVHLRMQGMQEIWVQPLDKEDALE